MSGEIDWGSLAPTAIPACRPFVKWAGGKRSALGDLGRLIPRPKAGSRYFEPFLGGGAVFFHLARTPVFTAVLSDVNVPLIASFGLVKDHVDELVTELTALPPKPGERAYYALRSEYNSLLLDASNVSRRRMVRCAALFLWLNHACFNGLYRVNSRGEFNVPYGHNPRAAIFDERVLRAAHRALVRTQAELLVGDFESVLESAEPGDCVYLDPPYDPGGRKSGFTAYTSSRFGGVDQARVARVFRRLVELGATVVLNNSSTALTRQTYREFSPQKIHVRRAINSDASRRGPVPEIVVVSPRP